MRYILVLFTLLLCDKFCSQNTIHVKKEPEVYSVVDQPAQFPGGTSDMMQYISKNIVFPRRCLNDSSFNSCKVFVKFIVDEYGVVKNPTILKGCNGFPECDEEVLRLINTMPMWQPGLVKDKAVKTYYTLPVNFKMQ